MLLEIQFIHRKLSQNQGELCCDVSFPTFSLHSHQHHLAVLPRFLLKIISILWVGMLNKFSFFVSSFICGLPYTYFNSTPQLSETTALKEVAFQSYFWCLMHSRHITLWIVNHEWSKMWLRVSVMQHFPHKPNTNLATGFCRYNGKEASHTFLGTPNILTNLEIKIASFKDQTSNVSNGSQFSLSVKHTFLYHIFGI